MKIIKADSRHKQEVFNLLDDFYIACLKITSPGKASTRESCSVSSDQFYDKLTLSNNSAIFLAEITGEYFGILTIHKIPQLRKWIFVAEIEEMFVRETQQWSWTAQALLEAAENWASENKMKVIRLESDNRLLRAHAFYEKQWFEDYWKAYMKKLLI